MFLTTSYDRNEIHVSSIDKRQNYKLCMPCMEAALMQIITSATDFLTILSYFEFLNFTSAKAVMILSRLVGLHLSVELLDKLWVNFH